jgi:hypothetical protein
MSIIYNLRLSWQLNTIKYIQNIVSLRILYSMAIMHSRVLKQVSDLPLRAIQSSTNTADSTVPPFLSEHHGALA